MRETHEAIEKQEELKPCPFCGGKAILERFWDLGRFSLIRCSFCKAQPFTREYRAQEGELIAKWNRRQP